MSDLKKDLPLLLKVSRGERPAELVLKNGSLINVFTEETYEADIAIHSGYIVRVGEAGDLIGDSTRVIDLEGAYIAPSFMDAHIHIESTLLTPTEFAKAAVPRGTGGVIADPHEIANVLGLKSLSILVEETKDLPMDFYFVVPSCVPAAPGIDTAGAELGYLDVEEGLRFPRVIGLGEMMNFPGVIGGDEEVVKKIEVATSLGRNLDGHAPLLLGKDLQAYILPGISTDHESTTEREVIEKLRLGIWVMLREGSLSKDLRLVRAILESNLPLDRCLIVCDDLHPDELLEEGHLDERLRRAVEYGVDPVKAVKMVTLNVAQAYGLKEIGAISPGYRANLVVLESLENFTAKLVIHNGIIVAREGELIKEIGKPEYPQEVFQTFKVKKLPGANELSIRVSDGKGNIKVRVIGIIENSLITEHLIEEIEPEDGYIKPIVEKDILEIVVVERHKATGEIAKGLVKGFGLKSGALASSVAHDSHNIVAVGADLNDLAIAIREVYESRGGLVAVNEGKVLAKLELPVAGLMSTEDIGSVANKFRNLKKAAKKLGSRLENPFMTLSFISLPVIPKLKMTTKGVFDVEKFKHVNLVIGD